MARPKKQTVDYFPHVATSGKTMFILESQFGNDGYAFWFKTLELLASTDGHVIDCRNNNEWRFLLAKTNVSEDIASRILILLAELEAIDSEMWKNRIIWSENFVNNIADVYKNRKTELPVRPTHLISASRNHSEEELLPVETIPEPNYQSLPTNRNQQSKVKETKVNKTRVNDSSLPAIDDTKDIQAVSEFYQQNFGLASPVIMEDLVHWCNDLSSEMVILAMTKAIENNKPYSYAKAIMKNWVKSNIKTPDDVKAEEVQFQQRKQQNNQFKNQRKEPTPDWMNEINETQQEEVNQIDSEDLKAKEEELKNQLKELLNNSKDRGS